MNRVFKATRFVVSFFLFLGPFGARTLAAPVDPCRDALAEVQRVAARAAEHDWPGVKSIAGAVLDSNVRPTEALAAALAGEDLDVPNRNAKRALVRAVACRLETEQEEASPETLGRLLLLAVTLRVPSITLSPTATDTLLSSYDERGRVNEESLGYCLALIRTGLDGGGPDLRWALRLSLDTARTLRRPGKDVRRSIEQALGRAAHDRRVPRSVVRELERRFFALTSQPPHQARGSDDCAPSTREALAQEIGDRLSDLQFYAALLTDDDPDRRAFDAARKRASADYVEMLTRCGPATVSTSRQN